MPATPSAPARSDATTVPYVPTRPDESPTGRAPRGPSARTGRSRRTIGDAPGQVRLLDRPGAPRTVTRLEHEHHALPELAPVTSDRPLWRRPAFVVAATLALVAVLVCIAVLLLDAAS